MSQPPISILLMTRPGPLLHSMQTMLEKTGLIIAACTPAEGDNDEGYMQRAVAEANKVRSVIIDLGNLDDLGLELCYLINKARTEARTKGPVLLLLGRKDRYDDHGNAMRAGGDAFVPRPLKAAELLEKLSQAGIWQTRASYRAQVQVPVFWTGPDGVRHQGLTLDVSEQGLAFVTEKPIPPGHNIAVEVTASAAAGAPSMSFWLRVLRAQPVTLADARFTSLIAGRLLEIGPGHVAFIKSLIDVQQKQRHQQEAAERDDPELLKDYSVHLAVQWLAYMLRPGAFASPPSPTDIPESVVHTVALQLLPHEQVVLSAVEGEGLPPDPTMRWMWAWLGLRVRCVALLHRAGRIAIAPAEEQRAFLDDSRSTLDLLNRSLDAFALVQQQRPEAAAASMQQTLYFVLKQALLLRDQYDLFRQADDPDFFSAMRTADDYFKNLPAELQPVRYERRAQAASSETISLDQTAMLVSTNRLRSFGRVVSGLVAVILVGVATWMTTLDENHLVKVRGLEGLSPVLAAGKISRGTGPRIFVGEVSPSRWTVLSRRERRQQARALQKQLRRQKVKSFIVYLSGSPVIHVDQGELVLVK